MRKSAKNGFTLVELLSALAVIGILGAILIPVIGNVRSSASKSKDGSNMRQLAHTILIYHSEHGILPGRVNRAVKNPKSLTSSSEREKWISSLLVDQGYLTEDEGLWSPAEDYGIAEADHNYILNNTIHSDPANFFGRRSNDSSKVTQPRSVIQLRSNVASSGPDYQALPDIWMITNLDGANYGITSTAGSNYSVEGEVETPWEGRNYAFFDGHISFIKPGDYPSRD
ncbi:type II secretion system protein [Cerasicoccus arenae]|uniref:Prepilin-type N-terminal cleavage/methylation domain-containing protein n=1 Tax=Cerasicoccus arenae TaxID=424488 RepID=A0A8J3D8Q9_9BACT|nr:type II secretion system protein [Cerasicoccus arenae]MBK1858294.1 type II secretion system protein [Cerasicoccus arenae]GHB90586.1 hypothetical protein GCM10007047_01700 [Cerasicoccus arenae]